MGKSVADGKTAVATAISAKGVNTAADATFETMATNISKISTTKTITIKAVKDQGGGDIDLYVNGVRFGAIASSGLFEKSFNITV